MIRLAVRSVVDNVTCVVEVDLPGTMKTMSLVAAKPAHRLGGMPTTGSPRAGVNLMGLKMEYICLRGLPVPDGAHIRSRE